MREEIRRDGTNDGCQSDICSANRAPLLWFKNKTQFIGLGAINGILEDSRKQIQI